jgi:hypothetical protein
MKMSRIRRPARPLRLGVLALGVGSLFGGVLAVAATAPAGASSPNLYVSPKGIDTGSCTTPTAPCKTLGYAYNESEEGDTINLAAGTYAGGFSLVETDLTLQGPPMAKPNASPGAVISGAGLGFNEDSDPLDIYEADVQINDIEITGAPLDAEDALGIFDSGVEMNDVYVANNVVDDDGAGIYLGGGDELIMNGGAIINNESTAYWGGGLEVDDDSAQLNSVTVSGNSAPKNGTGEGGGIFNDGDVDLTGTTLVEHNSAANDGGGIEECPDAELSIGTSAVVSLNKPNNIGTTDPDGICAGGG